MRDTVRRLEIPPHSHRLLFLLTVLSGGERIPGAPYPVHRIRLERVIEGPIDTLAVGTSGVFEVASERVPLLANRRYLVAATPTQMIPGVLLFDAVEVTPANEEAVLAANRPTTP